MGMKFCPKCGNLMFPDKKRKVWVCRNCGYEEPLDVEKDKNKYRISQKVEHRPDEMGFVVEEIETLPTAHVTCPKCGHNEAWYWEVQTRAGDEPSTVFYKCKKCGHVWRSYD